jgi:hypothetical protein
MPSGRAGLATATRLPVTLEPPANSLDSDLVHALAKGRLCDGWYFLGKLKFTRDNKILKKMSLWAFNGDPLCEDPVKSQAEK